MPKSNIENLCSDPIVAANLIHTYTSELVLPLDEREVIEKLFEEINKIFSNSLEDCDANKQRVYTNLNVIVEKVLKYIN